MRLEKLQEIIGEAKEVNYNGETFTIGLNSTRNFSDVPNGGITQKYDRMGRFQTATLIYMALQLRRFTDKGHGVYIYVKPEFRLDMLLPQAIELSGRSELIKIKLCDSPELLKYRTNLPFDKIGKIKFANCASLQEVTYQRKKFKSVTDISNFLKDKMDIIWNMSTDKSNDLSLIEFYKTGNAKNIFVNLNDIRTLSMSSKAMDYDFATRIKSKQV